jgi:hypothetical protein
VRHLVTNNEAGKIPNSRRILEVLSETQKPRLTGWLCVLIGTWAVVLVVGMLSFAYYVYQPGSSGAAPFALAETSTTVFSDGVLSGGDAAKNTYHLAMFVHPRCPCSNASIRELARLMTSCHGRLEATVYCYRPAAETDQWIHGALHDRATEIPGVVVMSDPGGKLAQQFGAETSGQVLVYDPHGKLCFQGGITAGRGHEGENLGANTVRACVLGKSPIPPLTTLPVFGCELYPRSENGI